MTLTSVRRVCSPERRGCVRPLETVLSRQPSAVSWHESLLQLIRTHRDVLVLRVGCVLQLHSCSQLTLFTSLKIVYIWLELVQGQLGWFIGPSPVCVPVLQDCWTGCVAQYWGHLTWGGVSLIISGPVWSQRSSGHGEQWRCGSGWDWWGGRKRRR